VRVKYILVEMLELYTISKADLELAIAYQTFDLSLLTNPLYFWPLPTPMASSTFSTMSTGEVCLPPLRPLSQGRSSLTPIPPALMASYLQRLDGGVRTPSALSDELRNDLLAHDGQGLAIIAPLGRTFVERFRLVDPEKLIVFEKELVRLALRPHLRLRGCSYRPIVAIDATLLLLRGDFEGKGKFWDHVVKRAIWGYKLYVIIAIESKLPLGFILRTVEEGQDDTQ
jgi:hypothetical protein